MDCLQLNPFLLLVVALPHYALLSQVMNYSTARPYPSAFARLPQNPGLAREGWTKQMAMVCVGKLSLGKTWQQFSDMHKCAAK